MRNLLLGTIVILLASWKSVFALDDVTMGVSTKHMGVAYLYMVRQLQRNELALNMADVRRLRTGA